MKVWIIKLGGSILTDKTAGEGTLNHQRIAALCAEIAASYQTNSDIRLIILHGGGSLGHPLVKKFDLKNAAMTPARNVAAGQVLLNMRRLTDTITRALCEHQIPALPFQTSSLVFQDETGPILVGDKILHHVLERKAVPVFGGDLITTYQGTWSVASADTLAVLLAQRFSAERLLFATNVAGVFKEWPAPPGQEPLKTLSRASLQQLATTETLDTALDVTGSMAGKLQALLALSRGEVVIFDGTKPTSIRSVLAGKAVGTTISLSAK